MEILYLTLLSVKKWPAAVLEQKAKIVTEFSTELRHFVKNMHETMRASQGIGLAANQVNDLRRIITIEIPQSEVSGEFEEKKPWHDKPYTIINPQIIKEVGKIRSKEGCLSFPDIYEYISRFERIQIKYCNEKGKELELEADGLFSICLQHEIDHLDGIVFIERMSRLKKNLILAKIRKRDKKVDP